jgi:prepilin-type processing-associated H-X9-DG protein
MCRNVAYTPANPASLSAGNDLAMGSLQTNGCNVVFADGSVHFLINGMSLLVLSELASRNGGESAQLP